MSDSRSRGFGLIAAAIVISALVISAAIVVSNPARTATTTRTVPTTSTVTTKEFCGTDGIAVNSTFAYSDNCQDGVSLLVGIDDATIPTAATKASSFRYTTTCRPPIA
jgi:hypothetical protein